ncbi:MAG: metallophosphoesterase, partial [Myxococcota bacterium]
IHFYIWMRLVRDPQLLPPWRGASTLLLVALALSLPAAFLLGPVLNPPWRHLITWPAFSWMGLMFILLVVLAGIDLARLLGLMVMKLGSWRWPPPEAGPLIARELAGVALAVTLVAGFLSAVNARSFPVVRNLEVTLPGLSQEMDGTSIVQLSDLHLGPTLGRDFTEEVARAVGELKPDVVAITGDLVDYGVDELRDAVAPLGKIEATHGVYFVTGNHEYYVGVDEWLDELPRLGLRVLANEHVLIGDGEAGFVLAGVNDPTGRMYPGHEPDLARALERRQAGMPVVLLAHQPLLVKQAAEQGVALQLSGHTHHGQIWPFTYAVLLQQPYVWGLVKHGPTMLYTSPGTGYWGPPMRLGSRSEITRIVLKAGAAAGP